MPLIQWYVQNLGTGSITPVTSPLPLTYEPVEAIAPVVIAVQFLMTVTALQSEVFDNDLLPLQGLLSPLLTTPSLAQVNDAQRAFASIRSRLDTLLASLTDIVVTPDQQPADQTTESIVHTLEERGLDLALSYLGQSQFSQLFALTSETASKSANFLKTMETYINTDLPTPTTEGDMPDGNILAGTSTSVLTAKEVP